MRWLVMLCVLCPAIASAAQWQTAASGQATLNSCPCGPACQCDPCECAKATATQAAASFSVVKAPTRTRPDLIVTVWESGCPHGERWIEQALPGLVAKGWIEGKHYAIRRVSPDDGFACPTFDFRGDVWQGYTTLDGFNRRLTEAVGKHRPQPVVSIGTPRYVAVTPEYQPAGLPAGYHSHRCDRCGHRWQHHDSNHGSYSAHTCPACGNLDWDIESRGSVRSAYRVQPMRFVRYASGSCPGGVCP